MQRKTHLKLTPKPHQQPLSNRGLDDNDDIIVNDDITFGRNRKFTEFGKVIHEEIDVEITDYVKFRLWLARQLALRKYDQVRG